MSCLCITFQVCNFASVTDTSREVTGADRKYLPSCYPIGKYVGSKYNEDYILLLYCAIITNIKLLGSRYRVERLAFKLSSSAVSRQVLG